MTTVSAIPAPGFADPTRQAQTAFRAIMDALAHPTRTYPLDGPTQPPAGLGRGLAAVALTLLDEDCTVWLGGALADDADAVAWLGFHTGARQVADAAESDFAFVAPAEAPALAELRLGTDEAPHVSTTLVLDVRGFADGVAPEVPQFCATGPGIDGEAGLDAPWAGALAAFGEQWAANRALFPRGVDLLLVDERRVSALPRTTRLEAGSGPAVAAVTPAIASAASTENGEDL